MEASTTVNLSELDELMAQAQAAHHYWVPDPAGAEVKPNWITDDVVGGKVINKYEFTNTKTSSTYNVWTLFDGSRLIDVHASRTVLERQLEDHGVKIGQTIVIKYGGLIERGGEAKPYFKYEVFVGTPPTEDETAETLSSADYLPPEDENPWA